MIAENINNFNYNNIIINEPVKNSIIIQSNFYKINYSNKYTTFNGIFILLDFQDIELSNDHKININTRTNKQIIDKISMLENNLLDFTNKKKNFKIKEQLLSGSLKYTDSIINYNYSNFYNNNFINIINKNNIILKISGLWETKDTVGITYKFILTSLLPVC
jgi:hypothetical protein